MTLGPLRILELHGMQVDASQNRQEAHWSCRIDASSLVRGLIHNWTGGCCLVTSSQALDGGGR